MSSIFTTGQATEANAATLGTTMAGIIRDALLAHEAWSLVEQFTPAGGAVDWTVLKCDKTVSGLNYDLFLVMGRRISTGQLDFSVGASYDTGTKVFSKYTAQYLNTVATTFAAEGFSLGTFTLGTVVFTNGSMNAPGFVTWPSGVTTIKWWFVAREDGFTLAFNGPPNGYVHMEEFEPLSELEWTLPVLLSGSNPGVNPMVSFAIQNPAVAGAAGVPNGALCMNAGGGTGTLLPNASSSPGTFLGFYGNVNYDDKLMNNQRPVAELGITTMAQGSGLGDSYRTSIGWLVGKLKRMRVLGNLPNPSLVWGDTYQLNGKLWLPYLPSDNRIWETGVDA